MIEALVEGEWQRVSATGEAIDNIHQVLEPLAERPCENPVTDYDSVIVDDCGQCASCRARAALSMLGLDLATAIGWVAPVKDTDAEEQDEGQ